MKVPFVSDAYRGNVPINWFMAKDAEKGVIAMGTPGLDLFTSISGGMQVRGLGPETNTNYLYAAVQLGSDTGAYRIDVNGNAVKVGTINSATGPVWVIGNGVQIWFVDGQDAYVYVTQPATWAAATTYSLGQIIKPTVANDRCYECTTAGISGAAEPIWAVMPGGAQVDNTVTWTCREFDAYGGYFNQVLDADFPGAAAAAYQDGYGLFIKPSSGQFWITALYDNLSIDSLDYVTAEGSPDNLVSVISVHREVWLFGTKTIEVWYNAGGTFPFSRISGVFIEVGCGAAYSPAVADNTVYWISNEGSIYRAQGYQPQIISTRKMEREIRTYSTISDAIGFGYLQRGYSFYQLTFPTANKTWVYDAASQEWHQRASWPTRGRHRANCYAIFDKKHLVGDFENGNIYHYSFRYYDDDGQFIERILETGELSNEETGKRSYFPALELYFDAGQGLESGLDPQVMLSWSDDGGYNWSPERWASAGKIGEYACRVIFNRLGSAFKRIFRIRVTDPTKWTLLSMRWRK